MFAAIWDAPGSGSGIVEAACAELGVDYEARDLDVCNDSPRRGLANPRARPLLGADREIPLETIPHTGI